MPAWKLRAGPAVSRSGIYAAHDIDSSVVKTAVIGASGNVAVIFRDAYRAALSDCVGTSFSDPGKGSTLLRHPQSGPGALRLEETGHQAVLIRPAKPNIGYCEQQQEVPMRSTCGARWNWCGRSAAPRCRRFSSRPTTSSKAGRGRTTTMCRRGPRPSTAARRSPWRKEIPSLARNYLVLRLSKIFGVQKGDGRCWTRLPRAWPRAGRVRAARDQIFCPTYVEDLVRGHRWHPGPMAARCDECVQSAAMVRATDVGPGAGQEP